MELPIQLKLFKKLELYQELKFQDRKSNKASDRLRKVWKTEKLILSWTAYGHHLISHSIDYAYVRGGLLKNKDRTTFDWGLSSTFGNLVMRGYVLPVDNTLPPRFLFTPSGLLMGEVINDVESSGLGGIKYDFLYYLTWTTALMGALFIIINFFILLSEILDKVLPLILK